MQLHRLSDDRRARALMVGPRLMVCGHWSWWYEHKRTRLLDGKARVMIEFGPGCYGCFAGIARATYSLEVRERYGSADELYDPAREALDARDEGKGGSSD